MSNIRSMFFDTKGNGLECEIEALNFDDGFVKIVSGSGNFSIQLTPLEAARLAGQILDSVDASCNAIDDYNARFKV